MKRKTIRAMTVICMTLAFLMIGGVRTSAGSYASCQIDIPFNVEDVSNKIPEGTNFEVEIKAHGKAPLPEHPVIRTDANGDYSIERIVFDQPGSFYMISFRNSYGKKPGDSSSTNGGGTSSPGTGEHDWALPAFGVLMGSGALMLLTLPRLCGRRSENREEA